VQARRIRYGVVDSTSERAFAEIAAGRALHFDVHVAEGQTTGRGRLGRIWHSAPGEGLYASVVLMPAQPWSPAALTMALGLATLDAVRELGLARASLKWPNDVMVDGAKLAGVLAETRDLDPRRPAYVAGIGVNVRQRSFAPALVAERSVTSLLASGVTCWVEDVLGAVLDALPVRCAQIDSDVARLEQDFVRAAGLEDRALRADVAAGSFEGQLQSLSVADGLRLRGARGESWRFALEHVRALATL
jgi:BirA family biotin operon repressor/biotin-[acetyl-CoA-carboxylase] ligase